MDLDAVFNRAADRIEREGWCQLLYVNMKGARCLLGAVVAEAAPLPTLWENVPARRLSEKDRLAIVNALRCRLGQQPIEYNPMQVLKAWNGLTNWNDSLDRTQDEVIALLRDKLPVPAHE